MARNYLIIIDMQKDFIYGPLGSKEARQIVPDVTDKVKNFDGTVIFTKDTHCKNYLQTQEGRNLPVEHCIAYSDGWDLIGPLEDICMKGKRLVYTKGTFASVNLSIDLRAENVRKEIESIELIGVCTDICVVSNALLLKAYMPEVPILVDSSCCAGTTQEKHNAALDTMRSCQIIVS